MDENTETGEEKEAGQMVDADNEAPKTGAEETADEKIRAVIDKKLAQKEKELEEREARIDSKLDKYTRLAKELEVSGKGMIPPQKKEETPEEYAKRVLRGEV